MAYILKQTESEKLIGIDAHSTIENMLYKIAEEKKAETHKIGNMIR